MPKTVALIGPLDTKGAEYAFAKECIESHGHTALLIDVGVLGPSPIRPDVTRDEVAAAAGTSLAQLTAKGDRGEAVTAMGAGAAAVSTEFLELPPVVSAPTPRGVYRVHLPQGTVVEIASGFRSEELKALLQLLPAG